MAVFGTTTASGVVNVSLTGLRLRNGTYELTAGGGFEGVTLNTAGCPEGAKVTVNASGNLEMKACYGVVIMIK